MTEEEIHRIEAPTQASGRLRIGLLVLLAVVGFALVVVFRWEIRAWWWARCLARSADATERIYYAACLGGAGEAALPAVEGLLDSSDAGVRSHAVAVLNNVDGDESLALLERACDDDEATIRESAVLGISFRSSPGIVAILRRIADHTDEDTAMLATSRLGAIHSAETLEMLRELAVSHASAGVRAQAIQSLSAWPIADVGDVLVACLEDNTSYPSLTATERAAREILAGAAPELASRLDEQASGGVFGPVGESNGARAARVLQALSGQDFGYLESTEEARAEAIEAWRRWWADKHPPE